MKAIQNPSSMAQHYEAGDLGVFPLTLAQNAEWNSGMIPVMGYSNLGLYIQFGATAADRTFTLNLDLYMPDGTVVTDPVNATPLLQLFDDVAAVDLVACDMFVSLGREAIGQYNMKRLPAAGSGASVINWTWGGAYGLAFRLINTDAGGDLILNTAQMVVSK